MTDDRSDARVPGESAGEATEEAGPGLQAQMRTARTEFEQHVAHARAEFEEANERIKKRTGRDLILAILIGVGIGAVALLSLIFIKWVFIFLALGVVVLGVVEFSRALAGSDRRIDLAPQIVAAVVVLLSGAFLELWLHWVALFAALAFVVVWRLITQMAAADGRRYSAVTSDVLAGTFVVFYVPFLASMAMVLLRQDAGEWWIIAFIAVAVVADTAAYASGLTFGKHPMAPRISPNKTWEGFAGAVVGAVAAGILLGIFMLGIPWWAGAILGAVILGTATTGDLGESMVKRDLGIKDMSSWLPGHGGVLDRLDSILPSATAALALYYLFSPLVAS
ncbi:phosphatidate cytidylyltransferase [Microbacterium sp. UBA837]|uniref:phosphatidate cytidylyltransferase n=1 Tax=Microbacterium sp. UBA837 TaxID=1946956 RepID=UPI000EDA1921|nr:phosphatidate cytidylyltransferase [Microbacterium sp. UBA837]HCM51415.1 phosphatidate cytidylyltransferase [Microbacterium sp.]|tara:strand:+ start:8090 stop:9097 length:1008 start_codon:yes stop_codon:yes gene_type:complete